MPGTINLCTSPSRPRRTGVWPLPTAGAQTQAWCQGAERSGAARDGARARLAPARSAGQFRLTFLSRS